MGEGIQYWFGYVRNLDLGEIGFFIVFALILLLIGLWIFSKQRHYTYTFGEHLWKVKLGYVVGAIIMVMISVSIGKHSVESRYAIQLVNKLSVCEARRGDCAVYRRFLARLGEDVNGDYSIIID